MQYGILDWILEWKIMPVENWWNPNKDLNLVKENIPMLYQPELLWLKVSEVQLSVLEKWSNYELISNQIWCGTNFFLPAPALSLSLSLLCILLCFSNFHTLKEILCISWRWPFSATIQYLSTQHAKGGKQYPQTSSHSYVLKVLRY